jgi:hypothetical protein
MRTDRQADVRSDMTKLTGRFWQVLRTTQKQGVFSFPLINI